MFSVRLLKVSFIIDCCDYALKPICIIFTLVDLYIFKKQSVYDALIITLVLKPLTYF